VNVTTARLLPLLFLALTVAGETKAAEMCPESIEVSSEARATHAGWQVLDQPAGHFERYPLRAVTFTDGHPRERAFLRPASSREDASNGERTDVYQFSSVSAEGIWLVCQYRETRELLFRPVDATVCEVTSTDRPDRPVAAVNCR
jgi:hypothetical protein